MRGTTRKQYAHPPASSSRPPKAKLSRYLFGIDYGPRDLRLALLDASGRISSPLKRALLYCYHYDLATGRYSLAIMRVVQLAGAATVVTLGTLIFVWTSASEGRSLKGICSVSRCFPSARLQSPTTSTRVLFLVGLSVVMSVLIATLVVTFAIKFRRRHVDEVGAQVHGGLMLELAWTIVPFLITMVIFFWGAKVCFVMASPPEETLNIYVVGKQWMWKVQHVTGHREINQLHIPIGRPVRSS